MITSMRCVVCDDLWPWPISSRSFDLDSENRVCSVASTVLEGFLLYLAQMITIIRGCVACYFFFSKSRKFEFLAKFFGLDLQKKLQFLMDSFHIYHKWSPVWGVCCIWWPLTLTYIFKVIRPWVRKSCPLFNVFSSSLIISIFASNNHYH